MFTPKVSAEVVKHLLVQAKKYGVDCTQALKELELPPESELSDLTSFKYGQLYRRLIFLVQDEWFCMFAGGRVPNGAFRHMCLTLLSATNLRQAFELAGEFCDIAKGFNMRCSLEEHQGLARISIQPIRGCTQQTFNRLVKEAHAEHLFNSIVAIHQLVNWLSGSALKLEGLRLTFAPGQTLQSVRTLCEQDVQYNQPVNELLYPLEILDLPVIQNHHALMDFLRAAPYQVVTQDSTQITTSEKVRSLLNRDIGRNMPSAERIAEILSMSVTTLRRHLADENSSYQLLKDECRLEGAIQLLACRDMTNVMVAERLGFDEPSAFFRAFKKWTGTTPGQYRKRYLELQDAS